MQDSPIQIGPISLQDFEIPASVRFGGRHRLAIHILSTGHRVVERLGPEDDEIVFQGTFSGPNAEARVQLFDNLRLSGETVWLTWESFRRRVVVKSFVADYHSPWWIPYRANCAVVDQIIVVPKQSTTLGALISADLSSALSASTGTSIQIALLQTTLTGTNALTTDTSEQAMARGVVGATLQTIDKQIGRESGLLSQSTGAVTDPVREIRTLDEMVTSAGSLAAAVNTRSYVGRIGTNLNSSEN